MEVLIENVVKSEINRGNYSRFKIEKKVQNIYPKNTSKIYIDSVRKVLNEKQMEKLVEQSLTELLIETLNPGDKEISTMYAELKNKYGYRFSLRFTKRQVYHGLLRYKK
jgi:DNA integrity scanning protein DisA with diadenylate cyclase activity